MDTTLDHARMDQGATAPTPQGGDQWNRSAPQTGLRPASTPSDDLRCVARIAAAEPGAIGELFDRHGGAVFDVIQRLVGNPDLATSLTAEAFRTIWREAAAYRPEHERVTAWLLRITGCTVTDWHRAHEDADPSVRASRLAALLGQSTIAGNPPTSSH